MRTRETPGNAFEHTILPYGDDNKQVRGVLVRCGHCNAALPVRMNTIQGHADNSEVEWQFIARRAEVHGWRAGKTRGSHRCPQCLKRAKFSAIHKSNAARAAEVDKPAEAPKNGETAMQLVENTRTLQREDRRLIFDKLNEVYVDAKVGYQDGWTDERVATDLGVPRAWVRVIRDENFGDEISSDTIREKVVEAAKLIAEMRAKEPDVRSWLGLLDKCERSLAEIRKVFK